MRIQIVVPEEHVSPDVIEPVMEGVTRVNQAMIRAGALPPWTPEMGAHVRWKPEPWGDEHFDLGSTALKRGWGDCDDLAPWAAATMRETGADPGARAVLVPSGPSTFHAMVANSRGELLTGSRDPSVQAGMRPQQQQVIGAAGEGIYVEALDPHDGRVYQGSLLPTTGPLSCAGAPCYAVRPLATPDGETFWQARCDAPIAGSRMVHVRSYWRHKHHRKRVRAHGVIPYAVACTHCDADPHAALQAAVMGAMLFAPPELHDRYRRFLQR